MRFSESFEKLMGNSGLTPPVRPHWAIQRPGGKWYNQEGEELDPNTWETKGPEAKTKDGRGGRRGRSGL